MKLFNIIIFLTSLGFFPAQASWFVLKCLTCRISFITPENIKRCCSEMDYCCSYVYLDLPLSYPTTIPSSSVAICPYPVSSIKEFSLPSFEPPLGSSTPSMFTKESSFFTAWTKDLTHGNSSGSFSSKESDQFANTSPTYHYKVSPSVYEEFVSSDETMFSFFSKELEIDQSVSTSSSYHLEVNSSVYEEDFVKGGATIIAAFKNASELEDSSNDILSSTFASNIQVFFTLYYKEMICIVLSIVIVIMIIVWIVKYRCSRNDNALSYLEPAVSVYL